MRLTNIKNQQSGFTIVELLIVVVVIAILAAITIVSYTGITQQANASAAESAANSLLKKANLYYADQGRYPTMAELTAGTATAEPWYVAASTFGLDAAADMSTGTPPSDPSVLDFCSTATSAGGVRVNYYGYDLTTPAPVTLTAGTTSCTPV